MRCFGNGTTKQKKREREREREYDTAVLAFCVTREYAFAIH